MGRGKRSAVNADRGAVIASQELAGGEDTVDRFEQIAGGKVGEVPEGEDDLYPLVLGTVVAAHVAEQAAEAEQQIGAEGMQLLVEDCGQIARRERPASGSSSAGRRRGGGSGYRGR